MENFITNKKYLWINIILMIITYGIWIIIYFYLKHKYANTVQNSNTRTFSLKVAGVTFKNEDGTDRQKLISKLHIGEELKLLPYIYENRDAVYVKTLNDEVLGNIPSENTTEICNKIKNNVIEKVTVKKIDKFINEKNKNVYYLIINIFVKSN